MTKSVLTEKELMYCEGRIAGLEETIKTFMVLVRGDGTDSKRVRKAYEFAYDYFLSKGYHTIAKKLPFEWIAREVQILKHQIEELKAKKEGRTIPPRKLTVIDKYCEYREKSEKGIYHEERTPLEDPPDLYDPDDFVKPRKPVYDPLEKYDD